VQADVTASLVSGNVSQAVNQSTAFGLGVVANSTPVQLAVLHNQLVHSDPFNLATALQNALMQAGSAIDPLKTQQGAAAAMFLEVAALILIPWGKIFGKPVTVPAVQGGANVPLTTIQYGEATAHITITNGVAEIEIGHIERFSKGFVDAIRAHLRLHGATSSVLNTGPVINTNVAITLGLHAQRGELYFGGTVRLVQGGPTPIFEITFPACP
jgi:hypothetical protein